MRALFTLMLVFAAAVPASAGTWEPRRHFGPYGHVIVGPDGSTLIGRGAWNDPAGTAEVRYARVGGDVGPDILVASQPGSSRAAGPNVADAHPGVFDVNGNATLVFSFDDGTETDCCHRYETALLPRGADAAVKREQIEPSGRNRHALQVAAGPKGERVGLWFVERRGSPNALIQVLDAPPGRRFGRPRTIADESVQAYSNPGVVAERGGAAWVVWTTERESGGEVATAVRVARRRSGAPGWRVRTIARQTDVGGQGLRISGWSLHVAAGRKGELLIGWKECDGDSRFGNVRCRVRSRWGLSGRWEPTETVGAEQLPTTSTSWGLTLDRRGRALIAFDRCEPDAAGTWPGECTLQIARGRDGDLGAASTYISGGGPHLAGNRHGQVTLLYQTGWYGDEDYAHYARAGSTESGFGPPDRYGIGYATGLTGFGVDDRGNAAFTYSGLDPDRTTLYRYRR